MESKKIYGLENSHNWGFDWFTSREEAMDAIKHNRKTYGHNDEPIVMSERDVIEADL